MVFYSGHGVPGLHDRRGYLLPVDANPNTVELNGYPIDTLYANLSQLKEAKSVRIVSRRLLFGRQSQRHADSRRLRRTANQAAEAGGRDNGSDGGPPVFRSRVGTRKQGMACLPTTCWRRCTAKGDANKDGRVTALEAKGLSGRVYDMGCA